MHSTLTTLPICRGHRKTLGSGKLGKRQHNPLPSTNTRTKSSIFSLQVWSNNLNKTIESFRRHAHTAIKLQLKNIRHKPNISRCVIRITPKSPPFHTLMMICHNNKSLLTLPLLILHMNCYYRI